MIDFVDLMEGRSIGYFNSEMEQDKLWYSDQWIIEPTHLGIRYQCRVEACNKLDFHGKKESYKQKDKLEQLENIIKEIKSNNLPEQTLFEGYITFNNNKSEAYRFLKLDRLDNKIIDAAKFYITDLIYLNRKEIFELPLFDRKSLISKVFNDTENVKVQQFFSKNKKDVFEQFRKQNIDLFLFKDLAAKYRFKQSVYCKIYKVPKQYFMIVMGYVENKDKEDLKNMVVALEGGQLVNNKLIKIMNVPVHSNDSRINLYDNKEKIIGKVFELLASEKNENDNKYQEARFIQMREDKKLEDCVF
ncbi:MAG: hypothetical protein PHF86_04535 [Candidatus Nanoarchaeia archaeon]|nr:hypothetical protein [Candidatus Nanoarchaeia archaeon]